MRPNYTRYNEAVTGCCRVKRSHPVIGAIWSRTLLSNLITGYFLLPMYHVFETYNNNVVQKNLLSCYLGRSIWRKSDNSIVKHILLSIRQYIMYIITSLLYNRSPKMRYLKYKPLIGKRIRLTYKNQRKTDVIEGKLLWVEGCWLGLELDNGEKCSTYKPRSKNEIMEVL